MRDKRFPSRKTFCFDVHQSDQRIECSSSDSLQPRVLVCVLDFGESYQICFGT